VIVDHAEPPQWPSLDHEGVAFLAAGRLCGGYFLFLHGPMSSGKSAWAIKLARNLSMASTHVRTFSTGKVERTKIASRDGQSVPAEWLSPTTRLPSADLIAEKPVLIIDEAQFLTRSQAIELHSLSIRHNLVVVCLGLLWSAEGRVFSGAAALLLCGALTRPLPHDVVCWCGARAVADARPMGPGDSRRYVPVCFDHATIDKS